jgi:hypothetical protein
MIFFLLIFSKWFQVVQESFRGVQDNSSAQISPPNIPTTAAVLGKSQGSRERNKLYWNFTVLILKRTKNAGDVCLLNYKFFFTVLEVTTSLKQFSFVLQQRFC